MSRARSGSPHCGVSGVALLLALAFAACGGPPPAETAPARAGRGERGIASWYGPDFHGRPTASGEVYDMHAMTAAHKTLPFGTRLRVSNLDNGRSAVVRINDRGPFIRGRILDVSFAAAQELGLVGPGTARVEIRVLGGAVPAAEPDAPSPAVASPAGPPPAAGLGASFTVQVGAFQDPERAQRLRRELERRFPGAEVRSGGGWHRVQVGLFERRKKAQRQARDLERAGYPAVVVRVP